MTQEAYGQAYKAGYRRTVRLLCSRGASTEHAEDMAQSAWLRGWERRHQLRNEAMIVSWVNAIAINVHRHSAHYEARYQSLPDLCGQVGVDVARIDAGRVLTLCRPGDRALFEQQMGGLTNEEIAALQGVSQTAIRIRFLRARRNARASLEERARIQKCAATSAA